MAIRNGTGTYNYRIPSGVGGTVLGTDTYKNYTVVAQYTHKDYTNANNSTVYNIEQSETTLKYDNVTYNSVTNQITINAQIRDYENKNVVGNTRFNIKVNGITMKNETGGAMKYSSTDGKISVSIDSTTSNPKYVQIVTLGREAYMSTSATTAYIIVES